MRTHPITAPDLVAVGCGRAGPEQVRLLRAAELSRHALLVELVRRRAGTGADARAFRAALDELARRQRARPGPARDVLADPRIGVWAARCLRALARGEPADLDAFAALCDPARERPRIAVRAARARLAVTVDGRDRGFELFGACDPHPRLDAWRARLEGGWRLLARYRPLAAEAMGGGLNTLMPLRPGPSGRPLSATSGWAFGAVAMSLPPDDLSCAETLVHEFQHLLLGAVDDLAPLLAAGGAAPHAPVPWRDDVRPPGARLQGAGAYVAMLGFWSRLRAAGTPAERDHAARALGRWLDPTAAVLDRLAEDAPLTRAGRLLVAAMREHTGRLGDRLRERPRPAVRSTSAPRRG